MIGAAQIVEFRETEREIEVPRAIVVEAAAVAPAAPKPALFAGTSDDELSGCGVPETWLNDVRGADEDSLLNLADHLPAETVEALLELASGGAPERPAQVAADADPFAHPDAQRRFRLVENADEPERALEFPWKKWTVFLHPAQRRIVENAYSGPARVPGSAGTEKTIVASPCLSGGGGSFARRLENPRKSGVFVAFTGTVWNGIWRMGWDSNPRGACTPAGFQDRCLRPLGHPSALRYHQPARPHSRRKRRPTAFWLATALLCYRAPHAAPLRGGSPAKGARRARGRGGIGRRAWFRTTWLRPWGFESLRPHHRRRSLLHPAFAGHAECDMSVRPCR